MANPTAVSPGSRSPLRGGSMPWTARPALKLLDNLSQGRLDVQCPDGRWLHFGTGPSPHAELRLHDWQPLMAVLRSGDIGFAEAYIAGQWSTSDLPALLELFLRNRVALESLIYGSVWGSCLHRLRHWLNRNSRAGSRRNIHAHYDIGNDFYKLWLDPSMSYSSAWFNGASHEDLQSAQQAKMRRALAQCEVTAGSNLLEIGCGWGALAECAVRDFGAHVTGVTLSSEQLAWARQRIAVAGLSQQVDLRLQDYRDIAEQGFDAIVSIEMFEAVGQAYWGTFFERVRDKLALRGRACIQTITIRDDLFERYAAGTDFIQQYIFPGGLLPSPTRFRAAARSAGLVVVDELPFGSDYAQTLRAWRRNFQRAEAAVSKLGFDRRFLRTWDFYLAYCEAAFATEQTDVVQYTLAHA
jgi:cyclopropane-fatty-acyl-phospholipid synthase